MSASKRGFFVRHFPCSVALVLSACGGAPPPSAPSGGSETAPASEAAGAPEAPESEGVAPADDPAGTEAAPEEAGDQTTFRNVDTHTARDTQGEKKSTLKATMTEAHLKFVVIDKDQGPIPGVVVLLVGEDGKKHYTGGTDKTGYAEALVPVGQKYELTFVSLKGKDRAATTAVPNKPNLVQKLTLRYKGFKPTGSMKAGPRAFVLDGVHFDTGKATIRPESYSRLDTVVEFMQHNTDARIVISGHTDNVGKKEANKKLSQNRALACRAYLVKKGIAKDRIEAVGYGDERPIAPNDTPAGRQRNRRIEAAEL